MHAVSKDYATAIIPPDNRVKKAVNKLLCKEWNVNRIEFFAVESPDILFAHGINGPELTRLCVRLSNSLGWQTDKRLAIVSWQPKKNLTQGERRGLLELSMNNLHEKLPGVSLLGVLLDTKAEHCTLVESKE